MSLSEAIAEAVAGRPVPGPLLEAAFGEIMDGKASAVQITALLVAMRTRGERVEEIVAAARALRSRAERAPLFDPGAVDTCGTGGDGADTFNISTVAAFVVAGAGVPVAKHCNRAASSRCGSFDLLEALGVQADLPIAAAASIAARTGIGFFFARRAHPAMRFVAPVRQELGIRTLMNCLGPLLNPVGARRQIVGVYDAALLEPLGRALAELGAERALVVHGDDGLDEITLTGSTQTAFWNGDSLERGVVEPERLGLRLCQAADLRGGDAKENAEIARAILAGESGPRRDVVLLNAAGALVVADVVRDLAEGLERGRQSLDSGAAAERLEALIRASAEAV